MYISKTFRLKNLPSYNIETTNKYLPIPTCIGAISTANKYRREMLSHTTLLGK